MRKPVRASEGTPERRPPRLNVGGHRRRPSPNWRAEILRHIGGEGGVALESGFLNQRTPSRINSRLAGGAGRGQDRGDRKKFRTRCCSSIFTAPLRPLDAITGATTTDDILNLIFSTFCIGKIKPSMSSLSAAKPGKRPYATRETTSTVSRSVHALFQQADAGRYAS